jgi:hypothetical protein
MHRNNCKLFCRTNRISAIVSPARKPVWSDITVTTSSGFLAASTGASFDARPKRQSKVLNEDCQDPSKTKRCWRQHRDASTEAL